jgi:hypothetical protein
VDLFNALDDKVETLSARKSNVTQPFLFAKNLKSRGRIDKCCSAEKQFRLEGKIISLGLLSPIVSGRTTFDLNAIVPFELIRENKKTV